MDACGAALAYGGRGWYQAPVRAGTKNPGSVVGGKWQHQSSRDPGQLVAWLAGTDHGIALHVGRSGAISFDVDHPEKVPPILAQAIGDLRPPFQSTRPGSPGRGHAVFRCPPGRMFSNSIGRLGGGWGEVRGASGVIIAAPTVHPDGGLYRWERHGGAPELPAELAAMLIDAQAAEDAATDETVAAFLAEHTGAADMRMMLGPVRRFQAQVARGQSRHDSAVESAVWAAKEARAGYYPAGGAFMAIGTAFRLALRGERRSEPEYAAIVAWSVGQANGADLGEVRSIAERKDVSAFSQPAGLATAPVGDGQAAGGGTLAARMVRGGVVLDEPSTPPATWGRGEAVIWSGGESLIIAGPDGVGKTTLAALLVRARLGIGDGVVLGMPVQPGQRKVLYLMMDRPRQIRRALRRIFTEADRQALDDKLIIWQGPPPADLARDPGMLIRLCEAADADTVIVDSLKDAALKLSDDDTGSGWNRARQLVTAAGIEILELHHPRKEQSDNKKPSALADLFGSRWISAGAGSVIMLWGKAGDPVVELIHLKQPSAIAGPWKIRADRKTGAVVIDSGADLLQQIAARGEAGITVKDAAPIILGVESPAPAEVQKARRHLDKLVRQGFLIAHGGLVSRWTLAHGREADREQTEPSRSPHADIPDDPPRSESQQVSEPNGSSRNRSRTSHADEPPIPLTFSGGISTPKREGGREDTPVAHACKAPRGGGLCSDSTTNPSQICDRCQARAEQPQPDSSNPEGAS